VNETIRAYLQRRVRWLFALTVCGWALIPICMALLHDKVPYLAFLGMTLFGGGIVGLNFLIKCPRCSANLGRTIAMSLALGWGGSPINFCPHCGVRLDEPRAQQSQISPIS
jgi:hypothetical protein